MPQLDPTWYASQLFWLAITFGLLYLLLSRVFLPPLMLVIEQRRQTREGDLARAEQLKADAEKAKQDYERALADAQVRSQQIFADAELSIKQAAEKELMNVQKQTAAQLEATERKLAEQKQSLLANLDSVSVELVQMVMQKLSLPVPDEASVRKAVKQASSSLPNT